jgi:hypothetical protein
VRCNGEEVEEKKPKRNHPQQKKKETTRNTHIRFGTHFLLSCFDCVFFVAASQNTKFRFSNRQRYTYSRKLGQTVNGILRAVNHNGRAWVQLQVRLFGLSKFLALDLDLYQHGQARPRGQHIRHAAPNPEQVGYVPAGRAQGRTDLGMVAVNAAGVCHHSTPTPVLPAPSRPSL